MLDFHACLWGIRLLLSLQRSVPLNDVSVGAQLENEYSTFSQEFAETLEALIRVSGLTLGWETRAREFVLQRFDDPESGVLDRESLQSLLILYRGMPQERHWSFDHPEALKEETSEVFASLVKKLVREVCRPSAFESEMQGERTLEVLETVVSKWMSLSPGGTGIPSARELLVSVLKELRDS